MAITYAIASVSVLEL